jgi:uncharacterized protein YcfL
MRKKILKRILMMNQKSTKAHVLTKTHQKWIFDQTEVKVSLKVKEEKHQEVSHKNQNLRFIKTREKEAVQINHK